MKITENELVRKYFGCASYGGTEVCVKRGICEDRMAIRILAAMEEPIKKGDKFILLSNDCGREIKVQEYIEDFAALGPIHPLFLRLPSRFQPSEKKECEDAKLLMETHLARFHQPPHNDPPTPEKCDKVHVPGHHAARDCQCACCYANDRKPADTAKCGCGLSEPHQPLTDGRCYPKPANSLEIETKIEELVEIFGAKGARNMNEAIRKVFRELVKLAREGK